MAIITAAAGGGNWNSTGTWNGGVIPGAADDVIINGTSGSVTVTDNRNCLTINFTNHANAFTINSGFVLTVGTTITLSSLSGFSVAGAGRFQSLGSSSAFTINFNGKIIPNLQLGYTAGSGTQTVTISGPTPTVQNLTVINGSGLTTTALAATPLNISTSLVVGLGSGGSGVGTISGVAFNFIGTACSVNCTQALGNSRISSGFTVVSGCTLTLLSTLQIGGGVFTFDSGSFLSSGTNGLFINTGNAAITLNTSNVTWYSITYNSTVAVSISSDINILTNFINSTGATCSFIGTAGAAKNINIQGSFTINNTVLFNMSNTIINLIGTGVLDGPVNSFIVANPSPVVININGTGSYTIGTATRNQLGTDGNVTINLVGTSVATVNAGHTLATRTLTLTLNTNNTGSGGNQIIWQNFLFGSNTTLSLTNETTFAGNLTGPSAGSGAINGQKFLLGGNLTTAATGQTILGTSTIELYGSNTVNWNTALHTSSYQNNITINKSGGTVNLLGTINWGATGRTLLLSSLSSTINAGTSTVTIPVNQSVTINNMVFNNLTLNSGVTVTQNVANTINSILRLSGNTVFAGTAGWTCASLIMTAAGTFTITLRNGVTYTTTTAVQLTGATNTARYTMISDNASFRAIWTVENTATQAITYVNGTRIDSSAGATVWTLGIVDTTVTIPPTATQNWNNGSQPSTVGYTFVN